MAAPTISSGAFRKMLAVATEAGLDPRATLAELGVDAAAVESPDGRIPIERLHAAWELFLAHAPDKGAAIAASTYAPGDYGLVGFVVMNSATMGEALNHVMRYLALWTDEPGIALDPDGTVRIVYRHAFADRPGLRAATESAPVEIVHGARLLSQKRIEPKEVRFAHPAPRYARDYEEFFGCRVVFDAPAHALVFRKEDVSLPLPKADAQLGAFLRTMANDALARRAGEKDESPLQRVREIIAEELSRGVPSIELVAKRMTTSERTLRRRLEESGTAFRDLLDDTRADLAKSYVKNARMPLAEVAFMLGFAEPSTFHRAFKRWTGKTPASFRSQEK